MKNPAHLERFVGNEREHGNLVRRLEAPSLWDNFLRYVARQGYPIDRSVLERDVTQPVVASASVQEVLVSIYRHDPGLARLCESLTDFDEGLQEWRYRHMMMVQRTIGAKPGTGGSEGVEYLRSTLFKPAFPDLWAVRSLL
jgi:tryptophan 2,3-dioxygenase